MAASISLPTRSNEDIVSDPRHSQAASFDDHDGEEEDLSWITDDDLALLRALQSPVPEIETKDTLATVASHTTSTTICTAQTGIDRRSKWPHSQPRPGLLAIPRLPRGTRPVRLVGEGAANAVFEIALPPGSQAVSSFQNTLLRVAKVPTIGKPSTNNYLLQHKFYHSVIRPLMGDYPVHQDLVILHNSDIISHLNTTLQEIDHSRDPRFRGSFVGQADWGLLVEDVRPRKDDARILIEFKPKWLSQSPSAPADAIRCRQCALELRKFVQNPNAQRPPRPENKPCPLALGNQDAPPQVRSPFRIAHQVRARDDSERLEAALAKVMDHDVIHLLRRHQNRLDKTGPLHMSRSDYDFSMAMTLRDCTCFALISTEDHDDDSTPIDIRLCDFDCKDPSVKHERWSGTERALIEGGFYTADWILCGDGDDDAYYHPPTLCTLEWTRSERLRSEPDIIHLLDKVDPPSSSDEGCSMGKTSAPRMYTHRTDLETLQFALRGFEMEPEGTPLEASYNPHRPRPVPLPS